ncbi:arabinose operon transcriptional regulator AraC [Rosenbergiella collisarenosi]|uniref:arabinose operon transcriptional regulator AraC n=1 Tax=Rosenbergiella collisarenosi TaxID=1544695 RepID=UPI001BD9757B|nr:arabinose operon transcriptional regulator AraC [Rosenbergiella collisarenosi]MBT0721010.1 arabinose operon transcriptional regulator AraC [Rosenbergiella collisarenosi]
MFRRASSQAHLEPQLDPLLPGFSFNTHLVAGLTPIEKEGHLDFFIHRPEGMQGYIINHTVKGQGLVLGDNVQHPCQSGDLLLFSPEAIHHYGRHPEATSWHHQWVYFRPRAYWSEWLKWPALLAETGLHRPHEQEAALYSGLFSQIIDTVSVGGPYSEMLAMNLLEQLLIRRQQAVADPLQRQLDPRIHAACQYMNEHLGDNQWEISDVAEHVCLSTSRLSHLFRQHLGVSVLKWREDQRINQAKLLLSTSQLSIASIGCSVGFDDQLYFSRVFRKCTGSSPSEFRQSFRRQGCEGQR